MENSRPDNLCFSEQIFDRKQLLGAPDDLTLNNEHFIEDRPPDRRDDDPVRVRLNDLHGCRHFIVFYI